jgi:diguanylate cyclase (GGDEF)-like protein
MRQGLTYNIGVKLGLLLASFGLVAMGIIGYTSYVSSRATLLKAAQRDLLTATQVLSRNFQTSIDEVSTDSLMLAAIPLTPGILRNQGGVAGEAEKKQLADIFSAMLAAHPEYFQIRLIDAKNFGLELVRVDRDGARVSRVVGQDLQEKAHYPYVFDTLHLSRGQVNLSDITLNREQGAHSGLDQPTVRLATPVVADDDQVLGVIVINLDLNGLFKRLKSDLPGTYQLYLSNHWGDFLMHPNVAETFGFDQGRRVFIQDSFPSVTGLTSGRNFNAVTTIEEKNAAHDGLVTAFARLPFGGSVKQNFVILGLSQPLDNVLLETNNLGWNTLKMILALGALAVVLAALVSRVVTGPLREMVEAVGRFSKAQEVSTLPSARRDEIGLLARSLNEMQATIVSTMHELNQSRQTLRHLSQHDSLTGLPNRALFDDRLGQAMLQAQSDQTRMALLFVDLDKFKTINDSYGHHIGDLVLKTAAARMVASVRQSDTVGRLGGDEFVILLPYIEHAQDAFQVAQKIVDEIRHPFDAGERILDVSVSIGVAVYPGHGDSESALSRSADAAMYQAKQAGGNRAEMAGLI